MDDRRAPNNGRRTRQHPAQRHDQAVAGVINHDDPQSAGVLPHLDGRVIGVQRHAPHRLADLAPRQTVALGRVQPSDRRPGALGLVRAKGKRWMFLPLPSVPETGDLTVTADIPRMTRG